MTKISQIIKRQPSSTWLVVSQGIPGSMKTRNYWGSMTLGPSFKTAPRWLLFWSEPSFPGLWFQQNELTVLHFAGLGLFEKLGRFWDHSYYSKSELIPHCHRPSVLLRGPLRAMRMEKGQCVNLKSENVHCFYQGWVTLLCITAIVAPFGCL